MPNLVFDRPRQITQTTEAAFRDDFPGVALDSNWRAPVIAGAAAAAVAGSNLTLTLTGGATDSVEVTSKVKFALPFRVSISLSLSARNANQEVSIEIVSQSWIDTDGVSGHYAKWKFDGTTATSAKTQTRNTDTAGTEATRTISTTAATTKIYTIDLGYDDCRFSQFDVDSVAARGAAFIHTAKVPSATERYYVRVKARNTGASSALTATIDFVAVQDVTEVMAEIATGSGFNPLALSLPVQVLSQVASTSQPVAGIAAHDAAISGNPVRIGARGLSANYTTLTTGDVADLVATLVGALVVRPYSLPELEWSYAAAAGGIINTSDVAVKAAAGAGLRNYMTSFQVRNTNAVATEFVIKDGSTVVWRGQLPATMAFSMEVVLPIPLKTTANTAFNVACITTAAAVYFNAQGYVAP